MTRATWLVGALLLGGALTALACETTAEPAASPAACAEARSKTLACAVLPGEYPPADCQTSAETTCTGGGCAIDQAKCGSSSTCLPMAKNLGRSVKDYRIRRLRFAAPDSLASLDFDQQITTASVDLKNPECGENGFDSWAWLLRVDTDKKTLTTGGAPPSADPFNLGYCFFNSQKGNYRVAPSTDIPIRFDAQTRSFSSGRTDKLLMPVFIRGNVQDFVVLPISDFAVRNVTLTDDDDCIGRVNPKALDGKCAENAATCSKWQTGGAMAGYVTIAEADEVVLPSFNKTLCALLAKTPAAKSGITRCAKGTKGDFCSSSKKACDCADAFWLAATFAASAVRIHDGSSVVECGEL